MSQENPQFEQLTSILAERFNLGRDANSERFTDGVLQHAIYANPKHHIKPNPKYRDPTPHDIGLFKKKTGMSTGEMARWLVLDNRYLNSLISATGFEKGNRMPSAMWGQLCEAAGLTDRLQLRPIFADIREEVVQTTEVLPTKHELHLLFGLSGQLYEDIAAGTGIPLDKLSSNAIRGDVVINEELTYVATPDDQLSNVHTTTCNLTINEWHKIRKFVGIDDSYVTRPPALRNCVFGTETGFSSPYGHIRKAHKDDAPLAIDETLATLSYNKTECVYASAGVQYSPPTPLELRAIIFWTGYSLGELSMLLGMRPKELGFLSSKNAINHVSIHPKTQKAYPPKTKFISFAQWRRFLEVFNLSKPRKLTLLPEIE